MWEIDGLDPAKEGTFTKEKAMMVETLVDASPDFSLKPHLAESWKQLSDTLWQFTLRTGVTFHNGDDLTAEIAAISLNRALEVNPSIRNMTKIKAIKAIAPQVLEIETTETYPALPATLVYSNTAITHPDSGKNKQDIITHPIGTGPYRLSEWQQAKQTVVLEKFADYWGDNPKIEKIVFRSIPDPSTRSLEIQKGSVDLVADAPYGDLDILRKKGLEVTIANTARVYMLTFGSLIDTPFADLKVRQALSQAINREEIVKYILFGMGKPATGSYEDNMVFSNQQLKPYPFNPTGAKTLLAEAGWKDSDGDKILDKDGKKLKLTLYTYPQRPGLKPMAMAIQQQWHNIGVATDVKIMDWSAIEKTMGPGDVRLAAFASAMIPDPDYFMRRMYTRNGGSNTWGYFNKDVEELISRGNKTTDPEKRLALYKEAQAIVYDDLPLIPVSYYGVNIITKPEVKGFVFNPVAHD
jgi:peptide/nickel transport system substrate-binding protein